MSRLRSSAKEDLMLLNRRTRFDASPITWRSGEPRVTFNCQPSGRRPGGAEVVSRITIAIGTDAAASAVVTAQTATHLHVQFLRATPSSLLWQDSILNGCTR